MPLTPQEQRELEDLELEKLLADRATAMAQRNAAQPSITSRGAVPAPDTQAPDAPASQGAPRSGPIYTNDPAFKRDAVKPVWMGAELGWQMPPSREQLSSAASGIAGMGIRGAPPAIGQAIGAATGPLAPVAVPVLGAIGGAGGEALAQMREDGPMNYGAIVGAGVAGAVPGAPLAGAGRAAVGREILKQGAGNLGGAMVERAVNNRGIPAGAQQGMGLLDIALPLAGSVIGVGASKALDTGKAIAQIEALKVGKGPRDAALANGVLRGYKVVPSSVEKKNQRYIPAAVESIGGVAKTNAAATLENQPVTDKLVREEFGLPPNADLWHGDQAKGRPGTFEAVREGAWAPYQEISSIGEQAKRDLDVLESGNRLTAKNEHEYQILSSDPAVVKKRAELEVKAAADIKELKAIREKARSDFKAAYSGTGDSQALQRAKDGMKKADAIESAIEETGKMMNRPDLIDRLRKSRETIAKSYVAEAALGHDGAISAPTLGKMLEDDVPHMSGNLRVIAEFERNFGKEMREAAKVPAPLSSQAKVLAATMVGGGALGGASGNPYIASAAATLAAMGAPSVAQKLAMSPFFQRAYGRPNYGTPIPDSVAQFARMTAEAQSRNPNPLMQFLEKEYPRKPDQSQPPRPIPYR